MSKCSLVPEKSKRPKSGFTNKIMNDIHIIKVFYYHRSNPLWFMAVGGFFWRADQSRAIWDRMIFMSKNLGASPQLEHWNAGIMEQWVLGWWSDGLMPKSIFIKKIKNGSYPLKYQYSIIPCLRQALKPQRMSYIFNEL